MDELRTECAVCGGPITKRGSDICCQDEDSYLLICCKGHLRNFKDRSATIDDVVAELYHNLDDFLRDRNDKVENYEESGVLRELERRVLRWINKKMIDTRNVGGIGFCNSCGAPILAGRNMCRNCADSGKIQSLISTNKSASGSGSGSSGPKSGMHTRRG
ncbi:MAG: hypothetical protein GC154_09820 [bacterium]|nr:hypothetical protein [bacterium]